MVHMIDAKTTFMTNHGKYYYNVMPFDLKMSPTSASWMLSSPTRLDETRRSTSKTSYLRLSKDAVM